MSRSPYDLVGRVAFGPADPHAPRRRETASMHVTSKDARIAELEAENRLYSESLANATQEIELLLEALQSMYDAYEGVYDMAVPTPHQSDKAKLAETLARAALEGKG